MRSILELLREIYERLTAGGTTEQQAVRSGVWVAGINVGDRALQLLNVIILARLLSPEAFGLLGIALLVLMGLNQFSRLGFDEALVQHEDENVDTYLNTMWVMKIARAVVIAAIAFLVGPPLAEFFGEPRAGSLIQVLGASQLLLGVQNPAIVYFQKNLNFHRDFIYQVGSRFADLVVAVAFALVFRSVWALIAGSIAGNTVKFVLSYVIHDYRPRFEFNLDHGREMFNFGKWMFGSSVLVFLYGQGDDAFVGWFFTASILGFYQLAYRFSNAPATEVTHVISRVAFPALSKVQDNVDKLRAGYYRTLKLSTVVAFPMAAGITTVAPQFVPAILGNQWAQMVPLMQLLSIWGGLRAIGANFGPVFNSVGRPDINTKLQAIKTILLALLIYPAAEYYGILGVTAAVVGNAFIVQPIAFYIVLNTIEGKIIDIIKILIYPLIGSVVMGISVGLSEQYLLTGQSILNLLLLIVFGVFIYSFVMILIEYNTNFEFISLYNNVVDSI